MKFGKRIQTLVDAALPAWKDKFLAYKRLKKHLNSLISELLIAESIREAEERKEVCVDDGEIEVLLSASGGSSSSSSEKKRGKRYHRCLKDQKVIEHGGGRRRSKRRQILHGEDMVLSRLLEAQFKRLLDRELEKLNEFFVEKEEEFVIKLQHFKEKVDTLKLITEDNNENKIDMINLQKDVVVFHGEMVLLENYCSLNYIGLVKIVKKHDRLTGAWLRLSFIPDVLRQPFYSTDILSRLVRDCEHDLLSAFPSCPRDIADVGSFERDTQDQDDQLFNEDDMKEVYKNTMAALQTIRNIRRGSSTYNAFSMPPCEENEDSGSAVEE